MNNKIDQAYQPGLGIVRFGSAVDLISAVYAEIVGGIFRIGYSPCLSPTGLLENPKGLVLEHRIYKHSLAFMYHVQKLGQQGNAKAQAIYEELAALVPNAEIVRFPVKTKPA